MAGVVAVCEVDVAGVVAVCEVDMAGVVAVREVDMAGIVAVREVDMAGVVAVCEVDVAGVVAVREVDMAGVVAARERARLGGAAGNEGKARDEGGGSEGGEGDVSVHGRAFLGWRHRAPVNNVQKWWIEVSEGVFTRRAHSTLGGNIREIAAARESAGSDRENVTVRRCDLLAYSRELTTKSR